MSEATTTAGTNIGELCADPNGFYPHPSDCQKYYQCAHGTPYEYTCASGLLWNDQLKYCDWAANVQCNLQPGSSTASSTATGQTVTSPSEVSSPSPVTTGCFAIISLKIMMIFLNINVKKITLHLISLLMCTSAYRSYNWRLFLFWNNLWKRNFRTNH